MQYRGLDDLAGAIEARIERSFGLSGPLDRQVPRLRRKLPAHLRREAMLIVEARETLQHPKLSRQIDIARMRLAHDRLSAHLRRAAPAGRRLGWFRGWITSVSVNLLALSAVALDVLAWGGHV
ncbi:hypothetical protein RGUI_3736 [Rhodovulum sp. P5]|nr:hypothetical protein RGUI_3736 [Rhodovulum sp. P5]